MSKPVLTKVARATLEKALAAMKKHPETVDMDGWVSHDRRVKGRAPYCGTTACIAGHLALAAGAPPRNSFPMSALTAGCAKAVRERWAANSGRYTNPAAVGYALLGDAAPVFHETAWPTEFRARYFSARTPCQRAAAVIARVRHWLKTGE